MKNFLTSEGALGISFGGGDSLADLLSPTARGGAAEPPEGPERPPRRVSFDYAEVGERERTFPLLSQNVPSLTLFLLLRLRRGHERRGREQRGRGGRARAAPLGVGVRV